MSTCSARVCGCATAALRVNLHIHKTEPHHVSLISFLYTLSTTSIVDVYIFHSSETVFISKLVFEKETSSLPIVVSRLLNARGKHKHSSEWEKQYLYMCVRGRAFTAKVKLYPYLSDSSITLVPTTRDTNRRHKRLSVTSRLRIYRTHNRALFI